MMDKFELLNSKNNKAVTQNLQKKQFPQICYNNIKQINYLFDVSKKTSSSHSNITYNQIIDEKADENQNQFDTLADNLYKKLIKNNGYIQRPQKSIRSKKKKKNQNQAEYDYDDHFIDDQGTYQDKNQEALSQSTFRCQKYQSVSDFYESDLYKNSIKKVEDISKKRDYKIDLSEQQLSALKKKIKMQLKIKRQEMKQQQVKQGEQVIQVQCQEQSKIKQMPQVSKSNPNEDLDSTAWKNQQKQLMQSKDNAFQQKQKQNANIQQKIIEQVEQMSVQNKQKQQK